MSRLQRVNWLLFVPIFLTILFTLTACPAQAYVGVEAVVDKQTGERISNATITMSVLSTQDGEEGKVVRAEQCRNCQSLHLQFDPTRGYSVVVRVEAPGYVPWEASAPFGEDASAVELVPLAELEAYQAELAEVIEQVEHLLLVAQRDHYPPEAFEQPLSEALVQLHETEGRLTKLAAATSPSPNDPVVIESPPVIPETVEQGRSTGITTQQVWVDARRPWQVALEWVEQGDRIAIEYIEGTWGIWGGPEGVKRQADGRGFVNENQDNGSTPEIGAGALLGKIGDGSPFYVGNYLEFTASSDGSLLLGNDDQWPNDNTGGLVVEVRVKPQTIPAGE